MQASLHCTDLLVQLICLAEQPSTSKAEKTVLRALQDVLTRCMVLMTFPSSSITPSSMTPTVQPYAERLEKSDVVVLGAAYAAYDWNRLSQLDPNYIGIGLDHSSSHESKQRVSDNPWDRDWTSDQYWQEFEQFSASKTHRFRAVYVDCGVWQHLITHPKYATQFIHTLPVLLKPDGAFVIGDYGDKSERWTLLLKQMGFVIVENSTLPVPREGVGKWFEWRLGKIKLPAEIQTSPLYRSLVSSWLHEPHRTVGEKVLATHGEITRLDPSAFVVLKLWIVPVSKFLVLIWQNGEFKMRCESNDFSFATVERGKQITTVQINSTEEVFKRNYATTKKIADACEFHNIQLSGYEVAFNAHPILESKRGATDVMSAYALLNNSGLRFDIVVTTKDSKTMTFPDSSVATASLHRHGPRTDIFVDLQGDAIAKIDWPDQIAHRTLMCHTVDFFQIFAPFGFGQVFIRYAHLNAIMNRKEIELVLYE
jgi:hypothetical protein